MSDLRDRIAAAIKEVDDMRVCKLSNADIKFMADAVIAELQPELNRHDTGCTCQNCWFNHYGKADDE